MTELFGHCSCKTICYRLRNIRNILNCHCTICRRLTGSAFASYVVVSEEDHKIVEGEEYLASYTLPDSGATKHFCKKCGSPLFNTNPSKYGPVKVVYIGTLKEGHNLQPRMNIFCDNKLDWVENLFAMKNYEAGHKK